MKISREEEERLRDEAYERGWVDSLSARLAMCSVPTAYRYYYRQGWDACAKYRWQDPNGRGVAPDRTFRIPRESIYERAYSL